MAARFPPESGRRATVLEATVLEAMVLEAMAFTPVSRLSQLFYSHPIKAMRGPIRAENRDPIGGKPRAKRWQWLRSHVDEAGALPYKPRQSRRYDLRADTKPATVGRAAEISP